MPRCLGDVGKGLSRQRIAVPECLPEERSFVLDTFVAMRKRCGAIFLPGMLCALCSYGQPTWRKAFGAYGQDEAKAVVLTAGGDIVVAGSTGSFGNGSSDAYLLKVSGAGDLIWSHPIGGPQIDHAEALLELPDGHLVFAGFSNGGGNGGYDGWLVKTDADGQVVWNRYYGGANWDLLYDIDTAANGGFYLTGVTYSEGAGAADGWILRVDAEGEPVWTRAVGGPFDEELFSGDATSDGGIAVAGSTSSAGLQRDVYVCKIDAAGSTEWERSFGTDSVEFASDILQTVDGRYSVVGTSRYWTIYNEHLNVMFTPAGDVQWTQHWGQLDDQEAYDQLQLPTGKLYTVGYTETTGAGAKDMFIFKCDPDIGFYEDQDSFGGEDVDVAYAVVAAPDGFIFAGKTSSFGSGGDDVVIVRTDSVCGPAYQDFGEVFDPVGVAEGPRSTGPVFFPNPATGFCRLPFNAQLASVRILDMQGRIVREWTQHVPQELDLRGLTDGAYQFVTLSRERIRASQPLIISGN